MEALVKIRIGVRSAYAPEDGRNRALLDFVRSLGYRIEQNALKNDRTWCAFTYTGEGEEVKNLLRRQGFADRDFKINVEYQRGWGFL